MSTIQRTVTVTLIEKSGASDPVARRLLRRLQQSSAGGSNEASHRDIARAFTQADNSTTVATDTIKNVINIVARPWTATATAQPR